VTQGESRAGKHGYITLAKSGILNKRLLNRFRL
jgi:hypothetical protein